MNYPRCGQTTAMDRLPGKRFMWEIEFQLDREKAICLAIDRPWLAADEYLVIHAIRGNGNDGGDITLALSETPLFDVYAKEVFRVNQRNPNRDGDDGA